MVVTYKTPKDHAAFDKYYFDLHVPMVHQLPGLVKFEVSDGVIFTPAGPSDIYRIATLHYADEAAMMASFNSAQGLAASDDAAAFYGARGYGHFLLQSRSVDRHARTIGR